MNQQGSHRIWGTVLGFAADEACGSSRLPGFLALAPETTTRLADRWAHE